MNKISQAEKEPNKFIRKAASWPKLKFLRIKPVIANATGISERNLTTVTEVEDIKLEVKPDEIEVTETPSVHKCTTCSHLSSSTSLKVTPCPMEYVDIWRTFAIALDRAFFLVHFVFQTAVLLTMYFKF